MEYKKITNLLDTALDNVPRFITKKWVEVHDQSGSAEDRCKPSKQIRSNHECYDQIYAILVMRILLLKELLLLQIQIMVCVRKKLAFKNNAPFTSSISKINNTLIDNAEHLNIVMPIYNLIEYSKNYSKTTGSF